MMRFVGIMGATGVGKSSVAVSLAQQLGGEVVSADSMQVYRGMDIGTAKITTTETCGVIHHMLDVVDIDCPFNAHMYGLMANNVIDNILSRGKVPIVVGGTGLYFYTLLYGLDHNNSTDDTVRSQLTQLYAEGGLIALQDKLSELDASALDVIDKHNYKRVMRAIEIAISGGSVTVNTDKQPICQAKLFTLNRRRDVMYANIDARVDNMISAGLVSEVCNLYTEYPDNTLQSLQAIGYKEIVAHLDGMCDIDSAVANIKMNSRRYAKRQISYFKRLPNTVIDCDSLSVQDVVDSIKSQL